MKRILIQQAKVVNAIVPALESAGTINGVVVDRRGYREGILAVHAGAVAGAPTAESVVVTIKQGDLADGSDGVVVVGKTATISAANGVVQIDLDLEGLKRYVKVEAAVSFTGGATPTIALAGTLTLGNAEVQPPSFMDAQFAVN